MTESKKDEDKNADDRRLADARRMNKIIEDGWRERYEEGKPCDGQAEAAFRIENGLELRGKGKGGIR